MVDGEGRPLQGMMVRLEYQNYSTESTSHELTSQTDKNGRVTFQPQRQSASLIERAFYTASAAMAGVHASFGRHASVIAFGDDWSADAVVGQYVADWTGSPHSMQSRIIAK